MNRTFLINRIRGCFSWFLLDDGCWEEIPVWRDGEGSSGGITLTLFLMLLSWSSGLSSDVSEMVKLLENFSSNSTMLSLSATELFAGESMVVADLVAEGAGQVMKLVESLSFRWMDGNEG